MSPSVSVIIPVYNVKPYLREALDSVINQTYQNLEIILIDDGSTDGSGSICDQYQKKDQRIRVIHQKNKGLSGARNAGMDVMQGDIVSFLDPDDAYLPEMIELLVKNMLRSQADISACGFYICQSSKRLSASHYERIFTLKSGCVSSDEALRLMLDNKISIAVWNKIYRRHLFDDFRFPEGHVFEDQMTTPFLIEKAKRIVMLKQPLLLHRDQRPGSITASYSEQNNQNWLSALLFKEAFILKHTPAVFEKQKVEQFEESLFREIVLRYTSLLSFNDVSLRTKRFFEKEIKKRMNRVRRYSFMTKAIFALYQIDPRLCYYTKCGCSAVLKQLRRLRHSHG